MKKNREQSAWLKEFRKLQLYGAKQARKLGIKPEDVSRLVKEYRREEAERRKN